MVIRQRYRVRLVVTGDCGHVLWEGYDKIEDKYPFWCQECDDDKRSGRYPWSLTSEVEILRGPAACPYGDSPCEFVHELADPHVD